MSESDKEGENLSDTLDDDYNDVSLLDKYDKSMIDDETRHKPLSARARRLAEETMVARDDRQVGRISTVSMSRAPRAMGQIQANQEGLIELNRLSGKLKVSSEVLKKANDILRRAYTGLKCFGASENECLPAASLEIASKICKKPLDREQLLKRAGLALKPFGRTLGLLHGQLGTQREVTISELCNEFKCNPIKASARQMLEVFKQRFWESLIEERREHADFSRPVFAVVAIILTAERHKTIVKVPDRTEMMQATGVKEDDYRFIREHMAKLCTPSALQGTTSAPPPPSASKPPSDGLPAANPTPLAAPIQDAPTSPPPTQPTAIPSEPSLCSPPQPLSNQPPPTPPTAVCYRKPAPVPRARAVLGASRMGAVASRAPAAAGGGNTVFNDGLPASGAAKRKQPAGCSPEARDPERDAEYQRWKAAALARPTPAATVVPASSSAAATSDPPPPTALARPRQPTLADLVAPRRGPSPHQGTEQPAQGEEAGTGAAEVQTLPTHGGCEERPPAATSSAAAEQAEAKEPAATRLAEREQLAEAAERRRQAAATAAEGEQEAGGAAV